MCAAQFHLGRRRLSTLLAAATLMRQGTARADLAVTSSGESAADPAHHKHGSVAAAETVSDLVFAALTKSSKEPVVFSPLCLADALNLLLAGAAGKTAHDLSEVTASLSHSASWDGPPNDTNTTSALRRASAVWLSRQVHPGPAATRIIPLADSPDDAVREINAWSSKETNGLVPAILDQIPDHSPLVVTSALHFGAQWQSRFDAADTSEEPFHRGTGPAVKVPFMRGTVSCKYVRRGTLHAVLMPYTDEQFEFLALAPVPGTDPNQIVSMCHKGELAAALRRPAFDQISPEPVDVRMPRLELSFMSDLRPALRKTRVAPMFIPGADFSGLTATPVNPSAVIQRVIMKVDEAGTEAAAVTAIPTDRSFHETPRFVADSPYLAVVLSKSGSPVVVALVTDPSRRAA